MVSILIVAAIVGYAGYVIRKKIKDIKEGRYCSCGCSDCAMRGQCHKDEE